MRALLASLVLLSAAAAAEPRFAHGATALPAGAFGGVVDAGLNPLAAAPHAGFTLNAGVGAGVTAGLSLRNETMLSHSDKAYTCAPTAPVCGEVDVFSDLLGSARLTLQETPTLALAIDLAAGGRRTTYDRGSELRLLGRAMVVGSATTGRFLWWLRGGAVSAGGTGLAPLFDVGVDAGFEVFPRSTVVVGARLEMFDGLAGALPAVGIALGFTRG